MVKEGRKGKFSRKKTLFLIVAVILLLLGGGAVLFRITSHREFEKFAEKLEGYSQQETSLLLGVANLEQEYSDELGAISYTATADVAKNRKHLARAREIQADYSKKEREEYLPMVEEEAAAVRQFLERRNKLWLWGNEEKFLEYIDSVVTSAQKAKESFTEIINRQNIFAQVYLDLIADNVEYFYFMKGYDDSSTWRERLKPFKKYTQEYKFEGEEQLKTLYPKVYKAIQTFKTLFAKTYEMCIAYLEGDYSKVFQLSAEIQSISVQESDLEIDWGPLYRPFYRAEIDAHLAGLSAINLYKEKKLGKISLGQRRPAAWALVWGSHLYALDHKDNYPKATSVSTLVEVLTKEAYLPSDFHFDQETFSCSFTEEKYELSFTDEVTGKEITLSSVD